MLLEYFHETATAKLSAVKEYVMDQLEAEHKFLVFAHHQEILNELETAVKKVLSGERGDLVVPKRFLTSK